MWRDAMVDAFRNGEGKIVQRLNLDYLPPHYDFAFDDADTRVVDKAFELLITEYGPSTAHRNLPAASAMPSSRLNFWKTATLPSSLRATTGTLPTSSLSLTQRAFIHSRSATRKPLKRQWKCSLSMPNLRL